MRKLDASIKANLSRIDQKLGLLQLELKYWSIAQKNLECICKSGGADKVLNSKNIKRIAILSEIWQSLLTANPEGLPTRKLFESIEQVVPFLNYDQFRVHLTRFKKEKELHQLPNGNWRMET